MNHDTYSPIDVLSSPAESILLSIPAESELAVSYLPISVALQLPSPKRGKDRSFRLHGYVAADSFSRLCSCSVPLPLSSIPQHHLLVRYDPFTHINESKD
jgi:hypothetical protein